MTDSKLSYAPPEATSFTFGEKLFNFWNRAVANIRGEGRYEQIGRLPTGEKGKYTRVTDGMVRPFNPDLD